MTGTDEILCILEAQGNCAYFGEPVSVLEHGLQAAHYARGEGADAPMVVAALLHDIGHLLVDAPQDIADWHADAHHEELGSDWLASRFGRTVSDPVRLHVAAKRYLCATSVGYLRALSPASLATLKLQGGVMSQAQALSFRAEPHFRDALRLRLWDDRAKVSGLDVAKLREYRPLIESMLQPLA